ncbi:MAG: 6,7-dimethyl-8-ribityllumazine synthase [Terriglobia bacterium]
MAVRKSSLPERLRRARIAVIRAEYNGEVTRSLEEKCLQGLEEAGVSAAQVDCFSVPGCFEIPFLAQRLAAEKRYDVLIALGAVIRGETLHFDLVANECARGIMEASLKHNVPVIFEVLAVRRRRDALRRAGDNRFNKGFEAAGAALSVLNTISKLDGNSRAAQRRPRSSS